MAEKFAVIDTETNWHNEVMSIGVVIAQDGVFEATDEKYLMIEEAAEVGGMFSHALTLRSRRNVKSRRQYRRCFRF